jgi:AAA+ ATPase superfamily predicted ATPase
MRYLLQELGSRPGNHVVVLDEYPHLQATSPELDSVLQAIIDYVAGGEFGKDWRGTVSVILCGSAMSVMTDILSGSSPLRGRAILDSPLGPFDYRQVRDFWDIDDLTVAFYVHAVLGGAPGYKDLTSGLDVPASPEEFHHWLGENVLNPSHALYREDAYLLREDPRVTRQSLYYSLLNAVAGGATTRSTIAARIGKKASDLDYPLNVLLSAGFLRREDDFLLQRKPTYLIADPIVRFHELITRRHEALAEERSLEDLWQSATPTFHSQILGPHFEEIARVWTARYASEETLGGPIGLPHTLQVNDRRVGHQFQIDVVAATRPSASRRSKVIQGIGEAKGTADVRTVSDLTRLEGLRRQLEDRRIRMGTREPPRSLNLVG